ncbi:fatty acid desaturase [Verrucomicrobiaceae bacterium R5-34]|nr:fatty acid desaturase [Verrucomicrobiaceae bacterium R5-34]
MPTQPSAPQPGTSDSGKVRHVAWCLLPHLLFVLLALGVWLSGWWMVLPLAFLLVVVPLLDTVTGWQDTGEFEKGSFGPLALSVLHWNTRLYALGYIGTVVWLAMHIERFSPLELGLLLPSVSLIGGIAFAACHELLHGKERMDQFCQRITTTFIFYPHYKLIHIRSHHVHAGTDHDENTAWMNESIYAYIIRTIPGSMLRSWQMEAKRSGFFSNKMVTYAVGQVAILLLMWLIAGPWGFLFYIAHVVGSHFVLEAVNYIQHYGLLREKVEETGKFEKTGAEHSWDTYHFFSSFVTFRVGHHSYHHLAVKPYYLLATEEKAPKLPAGYFWTIAVVLLPPWWRKVAHARLGVE